MNARAILSLTAAAALGLVSLACDSAQTSSPEAKASAEAKAERAEDKAEDKARDAGDKAEDAAEKAGDRIASAADKAGQAIERAADKAGPAVESAAEKAKPTMDAAGRKIDAAKQTVDIKTALMADPSLDASRIDVDTDAEGRMVHLKGTVATAQQKATAERIAKEKAAGYTVHNMLVVTSR
ncbi:MAG TPA: BON domain-containing protein [Vicinamibacteria bacterium]|nr:BON domain-containing protein [Vicinamibacteria bacterium]